MFAPDRIYSFDSETDNSRGLGLDPTQARITDLSLSTEIGETVFTDAAEYAMLTAFDEAVFVLAPGLISTWNGTHFDAPFLDTRLQKVGKDHHSFVFTPTPMYPPKYDLLPGHDSGLTFTALSKTGIHVHLDIAYLYKPVAERQGVKWGLKPVARAMGLPVIELDREHLERYTDEERRAYAASDAWLTRQLTLIALGVPVALAMGEGSRT